MHRSWWRILAVWIARACWRWRIERLVIPCSESSPIARVFRGGRWPHALAVARSLGARVEVIATQEFENEQYASNPPNRCYYCKAELFAKMNALARERGFSAIAYGENADDPAHLRPGSKAAAEFAVVAPLKEAGLTKAEVRELSRFYGLPTADAPAQPCLSSRIPHGTTVTREALGLIERGEETVRSLGFRVFRVRYLAPSGARVQIAPEEMQPWRGCAIRFAGFARGGVWCRRDRSERIPRFLGLNEATYLLRAQGQRLEIRPIRSRRSYFE